MGAAIRMITTYDKYILKRGWLMILLLNAVLIMIFVVVDFSEKTDDFTDRGAQWSQILQQYYLPYIPEILRLITPVSVFVTTLFLTGQMADRLELIAYRSAGVSFDRLIKPFLGIALMAMLLVSVLDGLIVPQANRIRFEFERQYLNKNTQVGDRSQIFRQESPTMHLSVDYFEPIEKTGYRFRMHAFEQQALREIIEAQRIFWVDSLQCWRLESAERMRFEAEQIKTTFIPMMDTVLTIQPRDLIRTSSDMGMLTYKEALEYLQSLRQSGTGRIEMPLTQLFGRLFYPLGVIIVTIIGFSVGFERRKGGQGVPIAIGLSVSFIYLTLLKTLEPLGYGGQLPPILAAALPHLVFAGAAVYLIRSYRSW